MKHNKGTAGFTLVELVIVIAVMGILAGAGTTAYNGYVQKAEKAADHALLSAVNTAFATACLEYGYDSIEMADANVTVENQTIKGLANVSHETESLSNDTVLGIATSFMKYMLGNDGLQFKDENIKSLGWAEDHFEIDTENVAIPLVVFSNGAEATLDQAALNAISDSYFGDLSETELANLINVVTGDAKDSLIDSVEETAKETLGWGYNLVSWLPKERLGIYVALSKSGVKDSGVFSNEKMEEIKGLMLKTNEAEYSRGVQMFTNGMILYTAENLGNKDANTVYESVKANYFTDNNIVSTGGTGGEAISTAIRETLYRSYLETEAGAKALENASGTDAEIKAALTADQSFKDYINSSQCKNDVAGLIGTMKTVKDNYKTIGNDEVVTNGLTGEDVSKLFGAITSGA